MQFRKNYQQPVFEHGKFLIIDSHGGAEDIVGLVAAIKLAKNTGKTILGITVTNGRRDLEHATKDVMLACKMCKQSIPIYQGAKQSILLNNVYPKCHDLCDDYTLLDKLQTELLEQSDRQQIQSQSACRFIAESIKKYTKQLAIITFGPLTNLALAFHLQSNIVKLSGVYVNGGQYTGVGNVINSHMSQGNFYYDPQAAHIVLEHYLRIHLNPVEKTMETSWKEVFEELRLKNEIGQPFSEILSSLVKKKYTLCGPLLALLPCFYRNVLKSQIRIYGEVMFEGEHTKGMLALNWLRLQVKEGQQVPNVTIGSEINMEEAKKILVGL